MAALSTFKPGTQRITFQAGVTPPAVQRISLVASAGKAGLKIIQFKVTRQTIIDDPQPSVVSIACPKGAIS